MIKCVISISVFPTIMILLAFRSPVTTAFVVTSRSSSIRSRHYYYGALYQQASTDWTTTSTKGSLKCFSNNSTEADNNNKNKSMMLPLKIDSPEEMQELGALLAFTSIQSSSSSSSVKSTILLGGDLGAGKTCMSRGFVQQVVGSNIKVTSPTFLLCNSYPIITSTSRSNNEDDNPSVQRIHHMDLYRLSDDDSRKQQQQLRALNLDQYLKEDHCLIEWHERLRRYSWPRQRLEINIGIIVTTDSNHQEEEEEARIVKLSPTGSVWEGYLNTLLQEGVLEDWIVEESSENIDG